MFALALTPSGVNVAMNGTLLFAQGFQNRWLALVELEKLFPKAADELFRILLGNLE